MFARLLLWWGTQRFQQLVSPNQFTGSCSLKHSLRVGEPQPKPGVLQWKKDRKMLLLNKKRGCSIYQLMSTENKSKSSIAKSKPSRQTLRMVCYIVFFLPTARLNEWNFVSPKKCLANMGADTLELFQLIKSLNAIYCTFPSFQLENCRSADLWALKWY